MKPVCAAAALALLCTAVSCRNAGKTVYASFADIDESGWDPFSPVVFHPYPSDSTAYPGEEFDLAICVRYRSNSSVSSLPLLVTRENDDDDSLSRDTVEIPLPLHEGFTRNLTLCETCDTVWRRIKLPQGFMVTIEPLLRKEDARGIVNIGLTLSRR